MHFISHHIYRIMPRFKKIDCQFVLKSRYNLTNCGALTLQKQFSRALFYYHLFILWIYQNKHINNYLSSNEKHLSQITCLFVCDFFALKRLQYLWKCLASRRELNAAACKAMQCWDNLQGLIFKMDANKASLHCQSIKMPEKPFLPV